MIKKGFTLAEVLITLSIVGVIAAVTLPTFVSNTTKAQIGPKLGKAASMLEQANMALLDEYNVDSFTDSGLVTVANNAITLADDYNTRLANHLKIDPNNNNISSDGVQYTFVAGADDYELTEQPHNQRIGIVTIDLDGPLSGPTLPGTDIFEFSWWNDGSLRPRGARNWRFVPIPDENWQVQCPVGALPLDARSCAGHIYANNMKVLYK